MTNNNFSPGSIHQFHPLLDQYIAILTTLPSDSSSKPFHGFATASQRSLRSPNAPRSNSPALQSILHSFQSCTETAPLNRLITTPSDILNHPDTQRPPAVLPRQRQQIIFFMFFRYVWHTRLLFHFTTAIILCSSLAISHLHNNPGDAQTPKPLPTTLYPLLLHPYARSSL